MGVIKSIHTAMCVVFAQFHKKFAEFSLQLILRTKRNNNCERITCERINILNVVGRTNEQKNISISAYRINVRSFDRSSDRQPTLTFNCNLKIWMIHK